LNLTSSYEIKTTEFCFSLISSDHRVYYHFVNKLIWSFDCFFFILQLLWLKQSHVMMSHFCSIKPYVQQNNKTMEQSPSWKLISLKCSMLLYSGLFV
jgi:hypothetical protein